MKKNHGDTVVTTLDAGLQQAAYNALGENRGAIMVMEASTGKILAMVSGPSYDPNTIAQDWEALNADSAYSPLLNRVTQGAYAPGSTFKIVTALEYMREHPDYQNYSYNCEGSITYEDITIRCFVQYGTWIGRLAQFFCKLLQLFLCKHWSDAGSEFLPCDGRRASV